MKMKTAILLFLLFAICRGAPAPRPDPNPIASPEPKPKPGFLLSPSHTVVTSPVLSSSVVTSPVVTSSVVPYSQYFKTPLYHTYHPYVYNLGYASGYSYNSYPYYVPLHVI